MQPPVAPPPVGPASPPFAIPSRPGPYALPSASPAPGPATDPAAQERREHFRPDIEGLRAVAVIAVLLFHVGLPAAGGGFIGVDIFYVISGFLITGLLLREGRSTGKVDLIAFYARRMRRLLPAALLVIVVTLAVSAVVLSPLRLTEVAGDAAASALYVANLRFALEATDYLAVATPSPLLHYWSLGVEEQFYLLWPLILLAVVRLLTPRFVGLGVLALAAGSFALSLYLTDAQPSWAFFSPVTRAWELAAGALLAVGFLRLPHRAPRGSGALAVATGLLLIVAGVVVLGDETPFPGLAAVVPVLGTVLVILGGTPGPTLPGRLLANPLAGYVGRISYSLYLWHWPLLILVPLAVGQDSLGFRLLLAALAIVLAALSTELVERPFRRAPLLARRPRGTVQLGLAASVAVGVGALLATGGLDLPIPWTQRDPVVVELAGVRDDLPASYADGCHLDYEATKPVDCVYGDPDASRTAVLFGDSHAAQWLPALDTYARTQGLRLENHTKSACSPVLLPLWERSLRREYDECFAWRSAVLKRLAKDPPEVLFVGSSRDYEVWDGGAVLQTREIYPAWQEALGETLRELAEVAGRVVLMAETPFINFDPVDCLADPKVSGCDPPTRAVVDTRYATLEATAAGAAGATVLSANELLCPGATCPVVVDDTVVFRDAHHVTATYMTQLAQPIGNLLEGRPPYPSASPSAAAPLIAADGDVSQ
jgi:peptidoglycan/LPS O-acetylase OafA/YrhL